MENGPFTGFTNENGGSLPWQTVSLPEEKEDETGLKSPFFGPLLVGGLEHELYFSIQLGMSSSQLTSIFFRGVGIPPTRKDVFH